MTSSKLAHHPYEVAECVADYLKAGDLEGIVSMFHPECHIYFPPTEAPKIGHEGVRVVFADFVDARPILISKVLHQAINGDTAILQAQWRFEDEAGVLIAEGSSTEVVKKLERGGWGYYIDCPLGIPRIIP